MTKKKDSKVELRRIIPKEEIPELVNSLDKLIQAEIEKHFTCLQEMTTQVQILYAKLQKALAGQEKALEKMIDQNQITEETLCNVLLAIRQNEYLQAWYPDTCGFPEQKVVGQHPVQKERLQKKIEDRKVSR